MPCLLNFPPSLPFSLSACLGVVSLVSCLLSLSLSRFVCPCLRFRLSLFRRIPRPSATALADEGDDELFADALSHLASDTNNDNDDTGGGEGDIRSVAAGGGAVGRGGGGSVGGAPGGELDEGEEATWAVEKEEALMVNRMFRM